MEQNAKKLCEYSLEALDGRAGYVDDLLFDDSTWRVVYLVVDASHGLEIRKVLIPTIAVAAFDGVHRALSVNMSIEQVRDAEPMASHESVALGHEKQLQQLHQWPYYWRNLDGLPRVQVISDVMTSERRQLHVALEEDSDLSHLRSFQELKGYRVQTLTGGEGHVSDMLMESAAWYVHSILVGIGVWPFRRTVRMSANTVKRVQWKKKAVYVDLSRDELQRFPTHQAQAFRS
jgi:hypothetical protein